MISSQVVPPEQDLVCRTVHIRVAQKSWKFCNSGQMIGEVIIKWRCPKTKTKKSAKSFFFTIAGSGDEQNFKKNIYIFALYITQAFFCPLSWNFSTTRSGAFFLGHPSVHTINTPKIKKKIFLQNLHIFSRTSNLNGFFVFLSNSYFL